MGAASLTTANDCSRETGLLSEEVMASWGNGREEARLLLESLALHIRPRSEHTVGEPGAWAPMFLLLQGSGDP